MLGLSHGASRGTRDNQTMATSFGKVPLRNRLLPLWAGMDGALAFIIFCLACAGMLVMYSSSYDYGSRFGDHARNMMIAAAVMFIAAQIPPQRLMTLAVPL